MTGKFLEDYLGNVKDWHRGGSTMVIDRFAAVPWENIPDRSEDISYVKIGWTLSMLLAEKNLSERILRYNASGLPVSHGGTLMEMAVRKGKADDTLMRLKNSGFNIVEISEGVSDMPEKVKERIADFVHSYGFSLKGSFQSTTWIESSQS